MFNDAHGFKKIYLVTGYTDLRKGIPGLAAIVKFQFHLDPYDRNTLFLFFGKRTDRIKALLWEGDGFLLLYKRLENDGVFHWPRTADAAIEISADQYRMLMQGLEVIARHPIMEMAEPPKLMWFWALWRKYFSRHFAAEYLEKKIFPVIHRKQIHLYSFQGNSSWKEAYLVDNSAENLKIFGSSALLSTVILTNDSICQTGKKVRYLL